MRFRSLLIVLVFFTATAVHAQPPSKILTEDAAVKRFVYRGQPLHPFCLDFTQEGATRRIPHELAKCSATPVIPKNQGKGWWTAEYPHEEGERFLSSPPYISYSVQANKGDRFLIASNSSGGGSGQFSNLFWVRLDDKQIAIVKDELGGDRCSGGLSDYRTRGSTIVFSANAPSGAIIDLTGVKIDKSITDKLNWGYSDCHGIAVYEYDLKAEKYELTAVEMNKPDVNPGTPPDDPQSCFNKLVLQYGKAKIAMLKVEKLRDLGRQFVEKCSSH